MYTFSFLAISYLKYNFTLHLKPNGLIVLKYKQNNLKIRLEPVIRASMNITSQCKCSKVILVV